MPADFAIYSTDIFPTTAPGNASPAPATLIAFDQDPIFDPATYDPMEGDTGRGSVIRTLGGSVVQQFAAHVSDRRIVMSDVDALEATTVAALQALYDAGTEFYFTDGYQVWKAKFEPKTGLNYRRNMRAAHRGVTLFSYEIRLVPTDEPSTATTSTTTTEA